MKRIASICFCFATVYCFAMNPALLGSSHNRPPSGGGGGGGNVWFDSRTDTGSADSSLSASGPTFMESMPVTLGQSGTADTLRLFVASTSASVHYKLALYDSSKNLLVSSSAGTFTGSEVNQYVTLSITPTAVSAGTVYVAFEADNNVHISTKGSSGGPYASQAYASFPPSTIPAQAGAVGQFYMGVHLQ